jgi:glutamate/tyrosine decarboxylase-like PLP-dependent enzyme
VEAAIDGRTICIYASAPSFPHGVIDPVAELAAAGQRKGGVPVHVDNCLGGVLLTYLCATGASYFNPRTGKEAPVPIFDLRVPGVRSVSIDLHKYGNAPKGASLVVFADKALRRHAYTVVMDWPGGLYATPTMTGSRSGAAPAVAWATLLFMGGKGYAETMVGTHALHQRLIKALASDVPGLTPCGVPMASIVSFTAAPGAKFDIYSLAARMEERGWHLNSMQNPRALQMCVSERFGSLIDQWLVDIKECTQACISDPSNPAYMGKGDSGIYGASAVLPSTEIGRILQRYCDILYLVRSK